MDTKEYCGYDHGGEYSYYNIVDYDICCTCENFHDNNYEERFECSSENCVLRSGGMTYGQEDDETMVTKYLDAYIKKGIKQKNLDKILNIIDDYIDLVEKYVKWK